MDNILLIVSGSVACYKAVELVRLATRQGMGVRVVMTAAAARLIGVPTFQAVSGKTVLLDEWKSPRNDDGMDHIGLGRQHDILLVAPASANFMAKAAAGIADDLALATFLAAKCPKFIAPAMNEHMWNSPANQRNLRTLVADGVGVLGPNAGEQACKDEGMGRMVEPAEAVDFLARTITQTKLEQLAEARVARGGKSTLPVRPLREVRIVVSTGATEEQLDSMRIISNRSSGYMGFCIAEAAQKMGARVQLIAGRTSTRAPLGIPLYAAKQGKEMASAVRETLATLDSGDWFFSAAAVADFGLDRPLPAKPSRAAGEWELTLQPTKDIVAAAQSQFPHVVCVGFAAQTETGARAVKKARKKLLEKGLPYIILNSVEDVDSDTCQLTIITEDDEIALPRLHKPQAARQLLNVLFEIKTEASESGEDGDESAVDESATAAEAADESTDTNEGKE